MTTESARVDGRAPEELRPVKIQAGISPYAEGSAEVSFGNTKLLVTASVEAERPRWMEEPGAGWITAEYGMLPRSTHTRMRREASSGRQGGRTLEIQRLIGRSLRAAVDLKTLGKITVKVDCDVLVADGGTRTAAISGGWVALHQALNKAHAAELISKPVSMNGIAAISMGVVSGEPLLDLCYEEDSGAEFDCNLVFNDSLELIEIQGTAEGAPISASRLGELIELGEKGAREIFEIQANALEV